MANEYVEALTKVFRSTRLAAKIGVFGLLLSVGIHRFPPDNLPQRADPGYLAALWWSPWSVVILCGSLLGTIGGFALANLLKAYKRTRKIAASRVAALESSRREFEAMDEHERAVLARFINAGLSSADVEMKPVGPTSIEEDQAINRLCARQYMTAYGSTGGRDYFSENGPTQIVNVNAAVFALLSAHPDFVGSRAIARHVLENHASLRPARGSSKPTGKSVIKK